MLNQPQQKTRYYRCFRWQQFSDLVRQFFSWFKLKPEEVRACLFVRLSMRTTACITRLLVFLSYKPLLRAWRRKLWDSSLVWEDFFALLALLALLATCAVVRCTPTAIRITQFAPEIITARAIRVAIIRFLYFFIKCNTHVTLENPPLVSYTRLHHTHKPAKDLQWFLWASISM